MTLLQRLRALELHQGSTYMLRQEKHIHGLLIVRDSERIVRRGERRWVDTDDNMLELAVDLA